MNDLLQRLRESAQHNDCEGCGDAADALDVLRSRLAEAQTNEAAWEATAQHHYKEARAAETRLAEAEALLREAREEIDAPTWSRLLSGFQDERREFLSRIDAHLSRSVTVEPCRWCGTPVTEQTDRPADYCSHDQVTAAPE